MKKKVERIAVAAIVAMLITLVPLVYWLYRPYDSLTHQGQLTAVTKTVEQGGVVEFVDGQFCNKGVDFKTTRLIKNENGGIWLLPLEFYAPAESVCFKNYKTQVELPSDIPPGTWTLVIRNEYEPNPTFRRVVLTYESTPFKVT